MQLKTIRLESTKNDLIYEIQFVFRQIFTKIKSQDRTVIELILMFSQIVFTGTTIRFFCLVKINEIDRICSTKLFTWLFHERTSQCHDTNVVLSVRIICHHVKHIKFSSDDEQLVIKHSKSRRNTNEKSINVDRLSKSISF